MVKCHLIQMGKCHRIPRIPRIPGAGAAIGKIRLKICVLGGGVQGVCLALELVRRGIEVDLVEAADALFTGASRYNEGKIHLGYVYAKDASLRSATLQTEAALSFAPLMRRWVGPDLDRLCLSSGFHYAVHRRSLLDANALKVRYAEISEGIRRAGEQGDYFGIDGPHEVRRLGEDERRALGYADAIEAVFATRELAVDPEGLADLLCRRAAEVDGLRLLFGHRVESVAGDRRCVRVRTNDGEARELGPYDHVVNCTWGGRLAIDATVGLHPPAPWSFRQKYYVRCTAARPALLASTTIVLGGFGDIVDYGNGDYLLSWYPVARRGWSRDMLPPAWPTVLPHEESARLAEEMVAGLAGILPETESVWRRSCTAFRVRGGIIYALGSSDVDEPGSGLHRRSRIGPESIGWYHSVDTGKYTTAPLFAWRLAERISAGRG